MASTVVVICAPSFNPFYQPCGCCPLEWRPFQEPSLTRMTMQGCRDGTLSNEGGACPPRVVWSGRQENTTGGRSMPQSLEVLHCGRVHTQPKRESDSRDRLEEVG